MPAKRSTARQTPTSSSSLSAVPSAAPPSEATDLERLGARLRAAREAKERSVGDVAPLCRLRSQELTAIEQGKEEPSRAVVAILDRELEAQGVLLEAWARVHISGLAERGADIQEARRQAWRVCAYAPLGIPRLFQDYAYAEAVQRCTPTAVRPVGMTVQATMEGPPYYTLLLEESVLARRIGDTQAMRGQFDKLLAYAEAPACAVHVIPSAAERHPGLHGGLWTLSYSAHHTVAYQPAADGTGHLITDTAAITHYTDAMAALHLAALPAETSAQLICRARATLDDAPKAIGPGADPGAAPTPDPATPAQAGTLVPTLG